MTELTVGDKHLTLCLDFCHNTLVTDRIAYIELCITHTQHCIPYV